MTTLEAPPQTTPHTDGRPAPSLMDPEVWAGQILSGEWTSPGEGEYKVIEPATGAELGVVGQASVADVRRAAAHAADAQKEWAAAPYGKRAQVLSRPASRGS